MQDYTIVLTDFGSRSLHVQLACATTTQQPLSANSGLDAELARVRGAEKLDAFQSRLQQLEETGTQTAVPAVRADLGFAHVLDARVAQRGARGASWC